jgi:predicted membrane protein
MQRLDLSKRNLRKFGITMGVAFFVLGLIILVRHKHPLFSFLISAAFFLLATFLPVVLKPIFIVWMKFALILSWFNTRLILTIAFSLIFTPIGLLMRLFGKDPLDRKIEKNKESYWKKKESREAESLNYERQF